MATPSAEDARKRYQSLPPEIKELLYSPEMSFAVQQIGKKNRLHIDQVDALNTEVGQVMLGFTPAEEFIPALVEMLNLDRARANAVAQDVNDMLFNKIRESMKKVGEMGIPKTQPPAPSAPSTSATPVVTKPTPAPVQAVSTPAPSQPAAPPTPAQKPSPPAQIGPMHSADLMLTQKTAVVAPPPTAPGAAQGASPTPTTPHTEKPQPPKPESYKVDPYREPPE